MLIAYDNVWWISETAARWTWQKYPEIKYGFSNAIYRISVLLWQQIRVILNMDFQTPSTEYSVLSWQQIQVIAAPTYHWNAAWNYRTVFEQELFRGNFQSDLRDVCIADRCIETVSRPTVSTSQSRLDLEIKLIGWDFISVSRNPF